MSSASTAGDQALQQNTKLRRTMQKAIGPLTNREQVCSYFCTCSNANLYLSNTSYVFLLGGNGRSMDDVRKGKRGAEVAAKKTAPILLPANATTNYQLHRNRLSTAPINIQAREVSTSVSQSSRIYQRLCNRSRKRYASSKYLPEYPSCIST